MGQKAQYIFHPAGLTLASKLSENFPRESQPRKKQTETKGFLSFSSTIFDPFQLLLIFYQALKVHHQRDSSFTASNIETLNSISSSGRQFSGRNKQANNCRLSGPCHLLVRPLNEEVSPWAITNDSPPSTFSRVKPLISGHPTFGPYLIPTSDVITTLYYK